MAKRWIVVLTWLIVTASICFRLFCIGISVRFGESYSVAEGLRKPLGYGSYLHGTINLAIHHWSCQHRANSDLLSTVVTQSVIQFDPDVFVPTLLPKSVPSNPICHDFAELT